jgi:hypothetical protein
VRGERGEGEGLLDFLLQALITVIVLSWVKLPQFGQFGGLSQGLDVTIIIKPLPNSVQLYTDRQSDTPLGTMQKIAVGGGWVGGGRGGGQGGGKKGVLRIELCHKK